jgi:phage terminase large subunit
LSEVQIPLAFKGLFDPHRYKAAWGGRGSAKSHSFATALVIMAAQRPMRIICAREIQNSLRESVKQLIEDKIRTCGLEHLHSPHDKETRLGESKFIYMGMWRNPDAAKSLEGADIFWGEEASAFSERSLRIVRPTMRKPGSELWFSWNPEFDHDPIDRFFRGDQGPPPDTLTMEVSWRDNPWFDQSPLRGEMDFDYQTDPAKAAHVWGGEYITAMDGAYYTSQLIRAREEGRVSFVARDEFLQTRAFFDIGVADSTAIWIAQFVGREIRVLDYIEGQGQPLGYYLQELRSRGWPKALCVLPHDGAHRDNITATRYEDHVRAGGFDVQIVKNQGKQAAMQRIEATRKLFPSIWFNEDSCRQGLKCLAAYHERRDPNRNIGLGPEHDWASHAADAFGLMCISYEEPTAGPAPTYTIPNFGAA